MNLASALQLTAGLTPDIAAETVRLLSGDEEASQ